MNPGVACDNHNIHTLLPDDNSRYLKAIFGVVSIMSHTGIV